MTFWLAPPCSGPHRAEMPADTEAYSGALELPTMRTVLVEQFCSWSACRISSRSSALATTGFTSGAPSAPNIMCRKLPA